jgi:hypothetical protein
MLAIMAMPGITGARPAGVPTPQPLERLFLEPRPTFNSGYIDL